MERPRCGLCRRSFYTRYHVRVHKRVGRCRALRRRSLTFPQRTESLSLPQTQSPPSPPALLIPKEEPPTETPPPRPFRVTLFGQSFFRCPLCRFSDGDAAKVEAHMAMEHRPVKSEPAEAPVDIATPAEAVDIKPFYVCPLCSVGIRSKALADKHVASPAGCFDIFQCPACPYETLRSDSLKRHKDKGRCERNRLASALRAAPKPGQSTICASCGYDGKVPRRLLRHQSSPNGCRRAAKATPNTVVCGSCFFKATGDGQMQKHQSQPRVCLAKRLRDYAAELNGSRGTCCGGCRETFPSTMRLLRHLSRPRDCQIGRALGDATVCPACAFQATSRPLLRRHMHADCLEELKLEEEPELPCDCGAVFFSQELLSRHKESAQGCRLFKDGLVGPQQAVPRPSKLSRCSNCPFESSADRLASHVTNRRNCAVQKLKHYVGQMTLDTKACVTCGFVGTCRTALAVHFQSENACQNELAIKRVLSSGETVCPVCKTDFDRSSGVVGHLSLRGACRAGLVDAKPGRRLLCSGCNAAFYSTELLERHGASRYGCEVMSTSLGPRRLADQRVPMGKSRCDNCDYAASSHDALGRHVARPENCFLAKLRAYIRQVTDDGLSCPHCGFVAKDNSRTKLARHFSRPSACAIFTAIQRLDEAKATTCPSCDREFPETLRAHLASREGTPCRLSLAQSAQPTAVPCTSCGAVFYDADLRDRHAASEIGCELMRGGLLRVLGAPRNGVPGGRFGCETCGHLALTQVALDRHVSHPANCDKLRLKAYLEQVTEDGVSCPKCAFCAPHRLSLLRHLQGQGACAATTKLEALFDSQPSACPTCALQVDGPEGLRTHLLGRERSRSCRAAFVADVGAEAKPLPCPSCGTIFYDPDFLERHAKSEQGCQLMISGLLDQSPHSSGPFPAVCRECSFSANCQARRDKHASNAANCVAFKIKDYLGQLNDGELDECASCGYANAARSNVILIRHLHAPTSCAANTAVNQLLVKGVTTCPSCEADFEEPEKLREHLCGRHGRHCKSELAPANAETFPCEGCQTAFPNTERLEIHQESRFGCHLVMSGALGARARPRVKLEVGEDGSYGCSECPYTAASPHSLRRHVGKEACGRTLVHLHAEELMGEAKGRCLFCPFAASAPGTLLRHAYSATGCLKTQIQERLCLEEPGTCPACEAGLTSTEELLGHLNAGKQACLRRLAAAEYAGLGKEACPHCDFRTANAELLARHRGSRFGCRAVGFGLGKTHFDGGSCDTCLREFPSEARLLKHILKEDCGLGEERASRTEDRCPTCRKVFLTSWRFANHLNNVVCAAAEEGEAAFAGAACPQCAKTFVSRGRFEKHVRRQSCAAKEEEEPFEGAACQLCDKAFVNRLRYLRHVDAGICLTARQTATREEAGFEGGACESCGAEFTTHWRLARHSEHCVDAPRGEAAEEELIELNIKAEPESFYCDDCAAECESVSAMGRHSGSRKCLNRFLLDPAILALLPAAVRAKLIKTE